jgi:hypothetical protein
MAIVQTLTTSFKQELLKAVHDFDSDTFVLALYTGAANLGADTTVYTTTNELPTALGYVQPGQVMTGVSVLVSGTTAYVTFDNVVWTSASFNARGALIYNSSKGNKSVALLNFGDDKISNPTTNTFTVQMPVPTATTALIRLP